MRIFLNKFSLSFKQVVSCPLFASKGFTLVEVLVGVTLLAMLVVTGTRTFLTVIKVRKKTEAITEVSESGGQAIFKMNLLFKDAKGINNCAGDTCWIETYDGKEIKYSLETSERRIYYQIKEGSVITPERYLTSDGLEASGLLFLKDTVGGKPPVVIITFTLKKPSGDPIEEYSQDFKTTISSRTYP